VQVLILNYNPSLKVIVNWRGTGEATPPALKNSGSDSMSSNYCRLRYLF
jgi:hypothetical protein